MRTEHLEARSAVSLLSYCRAAVVVGKYGHTIVERNRLRRQLRELVRLYLIPFCTNQDLVIKALPTAYSVDFGRLGAEIGQIKMQIAANTPEG